MANPETAPYLVLGETRKRRLRDRLGGLLDGWYGTWAAVPPAAGVQPELSVEVAHRDAALRGDTWVFLGSRGEETLLKVTVPIDVLRLLSGVVPVAASGVFTHPLDASHGEGIASMLTERIVAALCTDIMQAALPAARVSVRRVGPAGAASGVGPARRGFTGQTLSVSLGTDKPRPLLELTLSPTVMDALLAGRPAVTNTEGLTGRRKASHEQRVTVSAVLGTAKVSWTDLQALCAGDVIVLEQSLSAPCMLRVGSGAPVAEAQVGNVGNTLAAQITRIHTTS